MSPSRDPPWPINIKLCTIDYVWEDSMCWKMVWIGSEGTAPRNIIRDTIYLISPYTFPHKNMYRQYRSTVLETQWLNSHGLGKKVFFVDGITWSLCSIAIGYRCSMTGIYSKLIRPNSWLLFMHNFIAKLQQNNNMYDFIECHGHWT